jgi:multiple sugar transport system permease protein
MGSGAAIAFILFAIIVVLSLLQRFVMRDRTKLPRRRRFATWEGK